jgi:hypothetical protein
MGDAVMIQKLESLFISDEVGVDFRVIRVLLCVVGLEV